MKSVYMKYAAAVLLALTVGCGGNETAQEKEARRADTAAVSKVVVMPPYSYSDTIHAGSRLMEYKLERHASDSLFVRDAETGDKYADNYYTLTITRDGSVFFSHRFTKASFASLLDRGFRKNGILDGFRYAGTSDGKLLFGACISYPDSDMSTPFVVTVATDGSFGIKLDDIMDVEEEGV